MLNFKVMPNMLDKINQYLVLCLLLSLFHCALHFYLSGIALTADTQMQKMPSDTGVQSMALALPPSQAR